MFPHPHLLLLSITLQIEVFRNLLSRLMSTDNGFNLPMFMPLRAIK